MLLANGNAWSLAYDSDSTPYQNMPVPVIDALKTLDDTTAIVAELIDGKSAAVFKTDDHYTYVVMPLTPGRG